MVDSTRCRFHLQYHRYSVIHPTPFNINDSISLSHINGNHPHNPVPSLQTKLKGRMTWRWCPMRFDEPITCIKSRDTGNPAKPLVSVSRFSRSLPYLYHFTKASTIGTSFLSRKKPGPDGENNDCRTTFAFRKLPWYKGSLNAWWGIHEYSSINRYCQQVFAVRFDKISLT